MTISAISRTRTFLSYGPVNAKGVANGETRSHRLRFARVLTMSHADVSERLAALCRRIATSGPEVARTAGNVELAWWAARASEIESDFVADIMNGIIREHIPDANAWDALKLSRSAREEALAIVESPEFIPEIAAANVKKARRLLGMDGEDAEFAQRVNVVATASRVPLELYRAVLRRVIVDGVDVSRTKYRNWIWDLHIAFSIGDFTVFDDRPVQFVSNDKMILEAARAADLSDFVRSFEEYSATLRSRPANELYG